MKKIALIVVALSITLSYLFWKYGPTSLSQTQTENEPVELKVWGFWEEDVARPLLQNFQALNPNIKVTYTAQTLLNYRTRVQTQVRSSSGPDVFAFHSSWTRMLLPDLQPAPSGVLSKYSQDFYPQAPETLTSGGKIYGVPAEVDGLALFVNEDILTAANLEVPKTWKEFVSAVSVVTVKNQAGQIQTSGAALGTTSNVDFWPEIIALLFLQQPKADLASPASEAGAEVLRFYTQFVTNPKVKSWDTTLPSSTRMFIDGRLAFYFAPSSQIWVIKSANPELKFKTVFVPQLQNKLVAYGSFVSYGVSAQSKNPRQSWKFVEYLASPQAYQTLNQSYLDRGLSPRPFPHKSLADRQSSDPWFGAYVNQGPYYKGWYLNSNTQDLGINEEMVGHYRGAVEAVLGGADPLASLQSITPAISKTLDKYTQVAANPGIR